MCEISRAFQLLFLHRSHHTSSYQDAKNKQAGTGILPLADQDKATEILHDGYEAAYKAYQAMIDMGVCREQARIVLPVGIYSKAVWTASLQAIMHFIDLRLDESVFPKN